MIKNGAWVLWVFLAVACGGKSHVDAPSTGAAGAGAGNAGAGNASAGNAGSCPESRPDSGPNEGEACSTPGVVCTGYGSLSCPLRAVCSPDSQWQIHCSSDRLFGPCSCPHPDPGPAPKEHRATAIRCSHTRGASLTRPNGSPFPNDECKQDSDCVDASLGDNGRCVQRGPIPGYTCSYDTCFEDSACAEGSVCQCRESPDSVQANYCAAPSTCRIDADCGENGYCSPSQSHEWCGAFYACHTSNDECTNDGDCDNYTHCDFDPSAKHWRCDNLCGALPP